MADEEIEEVEEFADEEIDPDEIDVEELDDELDEEFVVLDDELVDLETEEEVEVDVERPAVARVVGAEEEDDEEDLVDPDDVEADLDTILKDRLVAAEDEVEDDEDEEVEIDDRGDPVDRIQPKRPGEFVCQSCFLLKPVTQLADKRRRLCRDCV